MNHYLVTVFLLLAVVGFTLLGLSYVGDKKAATYSWAFCFAVAGFSIVALFKMWMPAIAAIMVM